MRIELKGIAWNHSRALPPLVATAQRFEELHPGVEITWAKRSLHAFGHASLPELAEIFDLLVVDHPMMGDAAATGTLVDLSELIEARTIRDMQDDSAGHSFESYIYQGNLFALPIDAAAPAASFRPDLLESAGFEVPTRWSELLTIARQGLVRMPGFPADLFLNFMGLCVSRCSSVAESPASLFERSVALECLDQLREFASLMPDEFYEWNPIDLYEQMSTRDDFAYCPFAYTYSNYSRAGFAPRHLCFGPPPALNDGIRMITVLGGTGLALSTKCTERSIALEYGLYVAGRAAQTTLYGVCGGQPARRSAWQDEELNRLTDRFFERTLESIETAYVRPRYPGYIGLQEKAGIAIADYLRDGRNASQRLDQIDALYRTSLTAGTWHA